MCEVNSDLSAIQLNYYLLSYSFTTFTEHNSCDGAFRFLHVQVLINSTLAANMTFTKTSQKFGQWSDGKANTVYGLGFSSEDELLKVLLLYSMLVHVNPVGCENGSCNVIDLL